VRVVTAPEVLQTLGLGRASAPPAVRDSDHASVSRQTRRLRDGCTLAPASLRRRKVLLVGEIETLADRAVAVAWHGKGQPARRCCLVTDAGAERAPVACRQTLAARRRGAVRALEGCSRCSSRAGVWDDVDRATPLTGPRDFLVATGWGCPASASQPGCVFRACSAGRGCRRATSRVAPWSVSEVNSNRAALSRRGEGGKLERAVPSIDSIVSWSRVIDARRRR
jgi:hypothetical protein